MAIPTNRTEFGEFVKRQLGDGVAKPNISAAQLDDCIDMALKRWHEHHMDAGVETYVKHQVTQNDIDNKYITLDSSVYYVLEVLPVKSESEFADMFDVEYQLHLNDLFDLSFSGGMPHYVQTKQYLNLLRDVFHGKDHWQYSHHQRKLYLNIDWDADTDVGSYIVLRVWKQVDSSSNSSVWADWWLTEYAKALVQIQWGTNLIKFTGVQLVGGVQIDGQAILAEGKENRDRLEETLRNEFAKPIDFFIG